MNSCIITLENEIFSSNSCNTILSTTVVNNRSLVCSLQLSTLLLSRMWFNSQFSIATRRRGRNRDWTSVIRCHVTKLEDARGWTLEVHRSVRIGCVALVVDGNTSASASLKQKRQRSKKKRNKRKKEKGKKRKEISERERRRRVRVFVLSLSGWTNADAKEVSEWAMPTDSMELLRY